MSIFIVTPPNRTFTICTIIRKKFLYVSPVFFVANIDDVCHASGQAKEITVIWHTTLVQRHTGDSFIYYYLVHATKRFKCSSNNFLSG